MTVWCIIAARKPFFVSFWHKYCWKGHESQNHLHPFSLTANKRYFKAYDSQTGPYAICEQHRPWSACTFVQAGLGLCCSFTESVDILVYVDNRECLKQTTQMCFLILTQVVYKLHKEPFHVLCIIRYSTWEKDPNYMHEQWSSEQPACMHSLIRTCICSSLFSNFLNRKHVRVTSWNLVHTYPVGWCIVYTGIGQGPITLCANPLTIYH